MRLSSFRVLLLALAMAVQTVAGGVSLARDANIQPQQAVSAHCDRMGAIGDAAPAGKATHSHDCRSCLICAGPPAVSLTTAVESLVTVVGVALLTFDLAEAQSPDRRIARSHCARAPPAPVA